MNRANLRLLLSQAGVWHTQPMAVYFFGKGQLIVFVQVLCKLVEILGTI